MPITEPGFYEIDKVYGVLSGEIVIYKGEIKDDKLILYNSKNSFFKSKKVGL